MSALLIPDAGPLLSLAAGNLLNTLTHFNLRITDVVKEETFDKGLLPNASIEAQRLLAFYNKHAADIQVAPTQVGALLHQERQKKSNYIAPRNMGELSIQSHLIELQMLRPNPPPVVLFEDDWFMKNAPSLAKPYVLMSTEAFLINIQKLGFIPSAEAARLAIAGLRPHAKTINVHQSAGPAR